MTKPEKYIRLAQVAAIVSYCLWFASALVPFFQNRAAFGDYCNVGAVIFTAVAVWAGTMAGFFERVTRMD